MNAQLSRKIVFWLNTTNGQLVMGLPEEYPAPAFYEKLVCTTAHDAERLSQRMREQETEREAMENEEREYIESELVRNLRGHIHAQIANARDWKNREFLQRHLELYDQRPDRTQMKQESYLHSEGYEKGH